MSDTILKAEKLYYEAVEALTRAESELARKKLEEAVALNPDDALIHEALGVTYKLLDDPSKALEAFKNVLELNPECLSAYRQMVQILLSREEEDQAFDLLVKWEKAARDLIARDENDLNAYRSLAECLFTMDEVEEAVKLYQQIIGKTPDDLDAYLGLADIYFETGTYEEVETVCKQGLERFPDNASLHLTLGLSYNYRNLIAKSIMELTTAYELNPDLKELPGLIEKLSELKQALGRTVEEIITESDVTDWTEGFIAWYDEEEGIGFIRSAAEEEYLLHFSALENPDQPLKKGEKVRFGVVDYPQGKLAVKVATLEGAEGAAQHLTADVKVLDREKGFGMIEYQGERLLFFLSHVDEDDKENLQAGDTITFSISETTDLDDKPVKRATNIRRVSSE